MSRSKKAAAAKSDTVTFKKTELIQKLEQFLKDEDACDGDWLNKVKVKLLGMQESEFEVELVIPVTVNVSMPTDDMPTKEEIAAHVRAGIDRGEWTEFDYLDPDENFEVKSIKRVSKK